MAGGGNYVLDKAYYALSTYNASAAAGVTYFRFVKFSGTTGDTIDLNTTSNTVVAGVVQDNVDQVKVATAKASVGVRMLGISKVVAGAAVALGAEIMSDTTGRAITAATTGNRVQGVALSPAAAAGDIIDVLLGLNGRVLP